MKQRKVVIFLENRRFIRLDDAGAIVRGDFIGPLSALGYP
jgi:hypothetical protein